jgi:hypothetical protein
MMSIPTEGECYSKLMEHLIQAQEQAAMLGHLHNANDHNAVARQWLKVSDMLKEMQMKLTSLAMGRLQ